MIDESLRGPFYGLSFADVRRLIDSESVVEIAKQVLERIDQTSALNAFVYVDADAVLAQAAELDARADRGPLHGIPIGIKDLVDVAGWPVTSGSRLLADRIAPADAEVVTRLRAAGALIVGMTLTHEFAYGPTGDISKDGPTHNPHDLTRMSGGSSAGSGAAVAAGLVPVALGTDTGGSVRVPAALCGCVGIKTAFGDVPVDGTQALAPGLDTIGVLAGDSDLAWACWSVLTGRDEPAAVQPQWARLDTDRVPLIDIRVDKAIRDLYERISDSSTAEIALGNWPEMRGIAGTVMSREAYDVHADQLDAGRADYDESTWERIDSGRYISDEQYAAARQKQAAWRQHLIDFLPADQVLVSPTVGIIAPLIDQRDMQVDGVDGVSTRIVTNLTTRWNLVGFPALSVPAGYIDGMPIGIQLIAKPGSEGALRGAADAVRAAVG